jgi:hypothetical protein
MNWKGFGMNSHGLIKVPSWHLPRGTQEKPPKKKSQSGQPVSQLKFKPSTLLTEVYNVTAVHLPVQPKDYRNLTIHHFLYSWHNFLRSSKL